MKSLSLREYLHYLEVDPAFLSIEDHEKFRTMVGAGLEHFLQEEIDLRARERSEEIARDAIVEALDKVADAQSTVQEVMNSIELEMHRVMDAMKNLRSQVENM